jgi:hypothetical protein
VRQLPPVLSYAPINDEPVRQLPPVLSYAPINMDRLLIKPTGGQAGAGAAGNKSDERHTLPRPDP